MSTSISATADDLFDDALQLSRSVSNTVYDIERLMLNQVAMTKNQQDHVLTDVKGALEAQNVVIKCLLEQVQFCISYIEMLKPPNPNM